MQITARNTGKKLVAILAALLMVLLLAVQVSAASPNVEEVITLLEQLQRSSIQPEWLPDIRTNEQSVQRMLDLYLKCSPAEQQEFSAEQTE